MTKKLSIYIMRSLAVVLIVNSHFNAQHIEHFKPFALYGYLGNLGNLIFFFISSYVAVLTFHKYKFQKLRWISYRIINILLIIGFVRFVLNGVIAHRVDNIFLIMLNVFNNVNFFSVLIGLTVLFPLFYALGKKIRLGAIPLLLVLALLPPDYVDVKIRHCLVYASIFLLGICFAKKEISLAIFGRKTLALGVSGGGVIFVGSTIFFSSFAVSMISKFLTIPFLFQFLESFNYDGLPKWVQNSLETFAKLSLYYYLTHLFFIDFSYHISRELGLFFIFILITPICYVEYFLFQPVLKKVRNLVFRTRESKCPGFGE